MNHVSLTRVCSMYNLSYSTLRNSLNYDLFKPLKSDDFKLLTPEEIRDLYEKMMFLKCASPSGTWRPTVSKDESFRAECVRLKRVVSMRSYQQAEESIPLTTATENISMAYKNELSSRNNIDDIRNFVKDIVIDMVSITYTLRVIRNILVLLSLYFILFSVCVLYYYF